MIKQLRKYISPFFLTRYYLVMHLKELLNEINICGSVLDIGCGNKPFESYFKDVDKYLGIDFKSYSKNKDMGNKTPNFFFEPDYIKTWRLPFGDEQFDNCVSFQVLEHAQNPQKLISEMYRITKKSGYILLTVPFLGGLHEEPNDYQRFTKYGLFELFKPYKCKIIKIKEQGSIFSTISILLNEYLNCFASKNRVNYFISLLIYPPFILFSYISLVLDIFFKSKKIFFNYLILVQNG